MQLILITAITTGLGVPTAWAQTRDGATFMDAMQRSYDFVTTGDLGVFQVWTTPAELGFECPTCAAGSFAFDIPETDFRIRCFVVPSALDGDFRLCGSQRPFHDDMPGRSPVYALDSRLVEQWLDAAEGLNLIENQYRDPWQVHTWVTCPQDGRVTGLDTSIFSSRQDETYPTHFTAFSGSRENWHLSWRFPECVPLLS